MNVYPYYVDKKSFLFGNTDMYQKFGITFLDGGVPHDTLLPGLRQRKVTIPLRHGAYDYGAKYYNERALSVNCITVRSGSRNDAREMAYILSKKSEIRFWNEPEKYYIGRIYEAPELDILLKIGNRFTLTFLCEPFAYGETKTATFQNLTYTPDYAGTIDTPTYIEIINNGTANVVNIRISQVDKKENY